MKHNVFETILGAVVLVVALAFLLMALSTADVRAVEHGYSLNADFSSLGGLSVGSDVRISGVKVGNVSAITLSPETYLATVTMSLRDDVQLPTDSIAQIASEGLLGGNYMLLEPGGDTEMLQDGDTISFTQAAVSLEQMIGKLIFSLTESASKEQ